jgi:hypothetical protein
MMRLNHLAFLTMLAARTAPQPASDPIPLEDDPPAL